MPRPAVNFSVALLGTLFLTAVGSDPLPGTSTAAPAEVAAPTASTAPGATAGTQSMPLAPSAATTATAPAAATAAAPAATTQNKTASVAPAASTASAAPAASTTATAATAAPAPATAPAPAPVPVAAAAAPVAVSGNSLPVRGMNMQNVEHIFGTPLEKHDAVGKPPITRWDYTDYVVYFEYNMVLNTVSKAAPFGTNPG